MMRLDWRLSYLYPPGRLERGRLSVSEKVFAHAVEGLKGNLQEGSILARRCILKSFVTKIEVRKEKGTLYYAFPLYALAPEDAVYLESTPGGVQNKGAHSRTGLRLRVLAQCE